MSYRLQIISNFAGGMVCYSDQVMARALCRWWPEVCSGVVLSERHYDDEPRETDVSLIHTTFDAPIYTMERLGLLRQRSRVVVGFMEVPIGSSKLALMDRFYYFGAAAGASPKLVRLPPPYEPGDYPRGPVAGGRKRLLLDHTPRSYGGGLWRHPTYDGTPPLQHSHAQPGGGRPPLVQHDLPLLERQTLF
jgi:hypothetical protein